MTTRTGASGWLRGGEGELHEQACRGMWPALSEQAQQKILMCMCAISVARPLATDANLVVGSCRAAVLAPVMVRTGILAALRSLSKGGLAVGVMITASHNPVEVRRPPPPTHPHPPPVPTPCRRVWD